MLMRYTGPTPSNVSRDAKYSVVSGASGDEIRLVYRVNARELFLLTTSQHPNLVKMVNAVKMEINGQARGVFYINEFGDVLVPDGSEGSYWAGHYDKNLEFTYDGEILSPKAPPGLQPGETWPGPHVGVRYILCAGGLDIRYESRAGNRITLVFLRDHIGAESAARISRRLARFVGQSGGRFYVNERGEFFTPGRADDGFSPLYMGNLDDDTWFNPPDGFERP